MQACPCKFCICDPDAELCPDICYCPVHDLHNKMYNIEIYKLNDEDEEILYFSGLICEHRWANIKRGCFSIHRYTVTLINSNISL